MTIQEILEAHTLVTVGSIDDISDKGRWRSECLGCEWVEPHSDERREHHRAHVAEVLEKHMQEREADAVRETARNIERLYPRKGLINRADLLADIEIAADRLGRGIHANGRDKRPANGR